MKRAFAGVVIVIFDVILVKAWLAARAVAAAHQGPAPSPVKYGIILAFTVLVLIALLSRGRTTSPRNGGSRNGGSRNNGGSGYTWSGRS